MQDETLVEFNYAVQLFNVIAGTSVKTFSDLKSQVLVNSEEAKEIQDAFDDRDAMKVLDGAVDNLYTCLGLLQRLESLGFDTDKAMQQVAENNLSKFIPEDSTLDLPKDQFSVMAQFVDGEKYYVIKDKNGKVRKPKGYVSVDLSDCLPADLKP